MSEPNISAIQAKIDRLSRDLDLAKQELQFEKTGKHVAAQQLKRAESLVGFYYQERGWYIHLHSPTITRDGVTLCRDNINVFMPTNTHPQFIISKNRYKDYLDEAIRLTERSVKISKEKFIAIQKFVTDCEQGVANLLAGMVF